MNLLPVVLILVWLITFVTGQLLFKRAMELLNVTGFRSRTSMSVLGAGILSMTLSFLLNLGLLQRFDLSYLYPFQGLSIVIITLLAAVVLKEKLSWRLTCGVLLITAGVMIVSVS
jgi:drug/metabolite transporter (DMT)-like permease